MSTIKSNILAEISKTFTTIGWDTAEAKGKLTNDSGMVQEAFEKEMTIEYMKSNNVLYTLESIESDIAKIKMLIGLLKE